MPGGGMPGGGIMPGGGPMPGGMPIPGGIPPPTKGFGIGGRLASVLPHVHRIVRSRTVVPLVWHTHRRAHTAMQADVSYFIREMRQLGWSARAVVVMRDAP